MALTQVVEHHLPTYAKSESERLARKTENEMKVQHDENATLIHVIYNEPIAWNVSKRREAN